MVFSWNPGLPGTSQMKRNSYGVLLLRGFRFEGFRVEGFRA